MKVSYQESHELIIKMVLALNEDNIYIHEITDLDNKDVKISFRTKFNGAIFSISCIISYFEIMMFPWKLEFMVRSCERKLWYDGVIKNSIINGYECYGSGI